MTMVVRISLCLGFGVLSMSQMASQLLWLFPFCVCILGHVGIRAKRRSVMFFAAITGPCSAIFFLSWRASVEFRRRLKITCRRLLQPRFFFKLLLFLGVAFFPVIQKVLSSYIGVGTIVLRSFCSKFVFLNTKLSRGVCKFPLATTFVTPFVRPTAINA